MTMTANAYVAFVNVLGFSSFAEADFDGLVSTYDHMMKSTVIVEELFPDVSWHIVSDTFILASPELKRLVHAVQGLLTQTLFNDLIVRGGIGFGRHVENTHNVHLQVVSEALVRAARTEKQLGFPCVALDRTVVTDQSWWPSDVPNLYRRLLYFEA